VGAVSDLQPPVRKLHVLEEGDAFVALATPQGLAAEQQHLLAASTLREVLLLDLRRPYQALMRWQHGAAHSRLLLSELGCSSG
jgi:hypothetical protein